MVSLVVQVGMEVQIEMASSEVQTVSGLKSPESNGALRPLVKPGGFAITYVDVHNCIKSES